MHRVLATADVASLDDHVVMGGGRGIAAALRLGPMGTIEELEAAGVRGRGGGGFPTGTKWRTVSEFAAQARPTTVIVNGAEGEPGSFKDRTLLRRNAFLVLEGALIAARTVGATRVVVAVKSTFDTEIARLETAITEVERAGWLEHATIDVLAGPSAYLFGEETALLEVVEGRPPFPRVAPPYRHGADSDASDVTTTQLAGAVTDAPPTLANNVETFAHVAQVLANGADWFREHGTPESPGSIVCTVSGSTVRSGVGEFALGTPLGEVIGQLGGGTRRPIRAVLSGVANPFISAAQLDTPLTYEDMRDIGSGLGAAGFIVFDESDDLVAAAQGVARFLAVESCGQCEPCKLHGLAIAEILARVRDSNGTEADIDALSGYLDSVVDEARCNLAHQQQAVVNSLLAEFPEAFAGHLTAGEPRTPAASPVYIAPIVDIVDATTVLDESQAAKQPDWTFDAVDSGQLPADRLA